MRGTEIRDFDAETLPGRVVFGAGRVERVPDEAAALGMRRVLVIGGRSAQGAKDRVLERLGAAAAGDVDEVRQHVPEVLALAATDRAREVDADGVVTIGGGSATGLGKAVALETGVPLLAVPTTYAGSEMTPIYGITGEHKRTGRDLRVLPRTVVYDPQLTVGLSPTASAASGMNAMAQAVEAIWARSSDPVTILLAEAAIRVLAEALPKVVAVPDDLDARSDALYGAFLAGTCLGRVRTGLHHRLCHAVGGTYGLPHAATHAAILPHVAAFNAPAAPEAASRIASALGVADPAAGLDELNRRLGNTASLAQLGLQSPAVDEVAQAVAGAASEMHPRPATLDELRILLHGAFQGRRAYWAGPPPTAY
jgi:maleylacetate reductase